MKVPASKSCCKRQEAEQLPQDLRPHEYKRANGRSVILQIADALGMRARDSLKAGTVTRSALNEKEVRLMSFFRTIGSNRMQENIILLVAETEKLKSTLP